MNAILVSLQQLRMTTFFKKSLDPIEFFLFLAYGHVDLLFEFLLYSKEVRVASFVHSFLITHNMLQTQVQRCPGGILQSVKEKER